MNLESVWTKAKTLNANHVIFVGLCCVIAFLFRASDSYKLTPVWRKRVDIHNYANKEYPMPEDRLPPPIITDLEGDSINEILLMTHDYKLTILGKYEIFSYLIMCSLRQKNIYFPLYEQYIPIFQIKG